MKYVSVRDKMIVGIIPEASTAEILLNNLSEADFNLADVSLIMRDQKLRDKIAKDAGPLKGVRYDQISARLVQAGLSAQDAQAYQNAVAQGKVLAAMKTAPVLIEAAKEMFTDQSGESIKEIKP
jgi:hypothetical protein